MGRRILVRNTVKNQTKVSVIAKHRCQCQGENPLYYHESLTTLVKTPLKNFILKVCERDKGGFTAKKVNQKVKTDGKNRMQYAIQNTLAHEIALVYF